MKKKSIAQRVLERIKESSGPAGELGGMSYGEIQRFIVEDIKGLDYDEIDPYYKKRRHRGYWSCQLTTLLNAWCQKSDGCWFCWDVPKPGMFFTSTSKMLAWRAMHVRYLEKLVGELQSGNDRRVQWLSEECSRLVNENCRLRNGMSELLATPPPQK